MISNLSAKCVRKDAENSGGDKEDPGFALGRLRILLLLLGLFMRPFSRQAVKREREAAGGATLKFLPQAEDAQVKER